MNNTNELPITTLSKVLAQKEVMVDDPLTFGLGDFPPDMTIDEFIQIWKSQLGSQLIVFDGQNL